MDINYSAAWYAYSSEPWWFDPSSGLYIGKETTSGYNYTYRTKVRFETSNLNGVYKRLVIKITPNQISSPGYTTAVLTKSDLLPGEIYNSSLDGSSTVLSNAAIATSYAYTSTDKSKYAGYNNQNTFYYIFDDIELSSNTTYYVYLRRGGPASQYGNGWVGFSPSALKIYAPDDYYIPAEYTITYSANGGDKTPATQKKKYGISLELASSISRANSTSGITTTFNANGGLVSPASTGSDKTVSYSFSGWKATNGIVYSAGAKYTANEATTLTAQWETTDSGSEVSLPLPTKTGYNFTGWYDSAGVKHTSYYPTVSSTLTAEWDAASYKVYFISDGHNPIISSKEVTYDNPYGNLPSTSKRGYIFKGWYYGADERINPNTIVKVAEDHYLIAGWTATSYEVYFADADGNFGNPYIVKYDGKLDLTSVYVPTKTGYKLAGWTTNEDGTDDGYKWSEKLATNWELIAEECGINENGSLFLYPMWSPDAVRIRYNLYDDIAILTGVEDAILYEGDDYDIAGKLKAVSDVFKDKIKYHHKAFGWYTESGARITEWKQIFDNIDSESSDTGYAICNVYAKITPRFRILYINSDGHIRKLATATYIDKCIKRVYPHIKMDE